MDIDVNETIQLTHFQHDDRNALVEHLSDWEIYRCTLRIPYPYTAADAERWLGNLQRMAEENGPDHHWAIRDSWGRLLGGIGLEGEPGTRAHRAEIGYWLGRPFWGQGIMSAVVGAVCRHAFEILALTKITAHVLPANEASVRVLMKNGFVQEGYFRRHFLKEGSPVDTRSFGRLR